MEGRISGNFANIFYCVGKCQRISTYTHATKHIDTYYIHVCGLIHDYC